MSEAKETKTKNVYQKLLEARVLLSKEKLTKSGVNNFAGFDYFELADILPAITKVFEKVGLIGVFNMEKDEANLSIVDVENFASSIDFIMPIPDLPQYVTKEEVLGNKTTTTKELVGVMPKQQPMQTIGGIQTYARRYLYLTALDIAENDTMDAVLNKEETDAPKTAKKTAVKTPAQKQAAVKEVVKLDDKPAEKFQIDTIKRGITKIIELKPELENKMMEYQVKMNDFQDITMEKAEKIIDNIAQQVLKLQGEVNNG